MQLLEIKLYTRDLVETERFYTEQLELSIHSRTPTQISFNVGSSKLIFVERTDLHPTYHFAFNIPKNQLQDAINWSKVRLPLLNVGDQSEVAHFESWNAKAVYFYDNNGNILEFIARFDLENESTKSFNSSSIECISEMGMVADQPIKLAEQLISENKCTYFEKGARSENFASLGDDNGLFIIVRTGRKWFPTENPAEKAAANVTVSIDGKISEIELNMGEYNE